MRKFLAVLCTIFVFFLIYFLQINIFSWFNIAGVKPNLFVILVLFIGLFMNKKLASVLGFIFGFFIDIMVGKQIGISCLVLAGIGALCGILDRSFSKESKITIILIVVSATFIYELLTYLFVIISRQIPIQLLGFLKIVVIEIIFNTLLTIILYPLIRNAGKKTENIFRRDSIKYI